MVVENATGNAARFNQVVTEYSKAPAVTRDRMYLDTMQQIYSSASKVLVDAKANGNMLYIPLDKLIAQTAASDAAVGSKSGPVQMQQPSQQQMQQQALPPQDAMQSMDTVRNRDARSRDAARERESR
jgi:membrane protease subunit HflK